MRHKLCSQLCNTVDAVYAHGLLLQSSLHITDFAIATSTIVAAVVASLAAAFELAVEITIHLCKHNNDDQDDKDC